GDEEDGERPCRERDHLPRPQGSARELAPGRARIPCIDARVDQPVQRHREAPGADHCDRDPEQGACARNAVDRKEGADVRERKREDGVLDLHERCEQARVADEARERVHVWRWAVASPANRPRAWPSAGLMTAKPSRQPPGEPGRFTTSAPPVMPATPRERSPWG